VSLPIHFDFSYYSTLKTREQIEVMAFFTLDPGPAYYRKRWFSFEPMIEVEDRIQQELHAKAQSTTNRWALQFGSADAALDPDSYVSLEAALLAIASPEFSVYEVSVRNIVPATPKVKTVPEPLPPKSKADKIREEVTEHVDTLRAIKTIEADIRVNDPDVANDPYLGLNSQQVLHPSGQMRLQDGLLKRKFDHIKGEILK
jgi:hypothetical protein